MSSTERDEIRLCTFVVGNLLLALPAEDVQEVLTGAELTPVPLAPSTVLGLLNLRGRIVPAVDSRARLGLTPRPDDEVAAHVILDVRGEEVSLVVDRMSDVVTVAAADLEDVPETVSPDIRRLLASSYQQDAALLLVLDPDLILAT